MGLREEQHISESGDHGAAGVVRLRAARTLRRRGTPVELHRRDTQHNQAILQVALQIS